MTAIQTLLLQAEERPIREHMKDYVTLGLKINLEMKDPSIIYENNITLGLRIYVDTAEFIEIGGSEKTRYCFVGTLI